MILKKQANKQPHHDSMQSKNIQWHKTWGWIIGMLLIWAWRANLLKFWGVGNHVPIASRLNLFYCIAFVGCHSLDSLEQQMLRQSVGSRMFISHDQYMTDKALWLPMSSCVGLQQLGLHSPAFLGHRMQNVPKTLHAYSGQLTTAEAYPKWAASWRQNCNYIMSTVLYGWDCFWTRFFIGIDRTAKINGHISCFWDPIKSAVAKILLPPAWWLQLELTLDCVTKPMWNPKPND